MMERRISSLIITAYQAMGEPALWPSFLKQYSELMKASVCGFQVHHFSEHRTEALSFVEMPSPASTEPKFELLRGALGTFGKRGVPV